MTTNSNEVTAAVDTQDAITDRYEVETNIVSEPEVKTKEEPAKEVEPESDSQTEPSEEPQESKTINPRTAARKAEKERLLREIADTKAENARVMAELAKYKQPAQPEAKAKDLSKEPNIQDYDDALEYSRDIAKYEAIQAFKQETSKLTQQKQIESYTERLETFKADKPDFEEKVGALLNSGLVSPEVEGAILSSNMGPELSYHFAQYNGDLLALRGLPKELLPKAIKEIESFIKQGGQQQEKPRVTQAPPPISPPSSTGRTNRSASWYSQEEIENMPLSEYQRVFMKK
jgi:hypothetical protein